jgi:hypothetical protein
MVLRDERFLAVLAGAVLIGTTGTNAQTAMPPPDAGHAQWRLSTDLLSVF